MKLETCRGGWHPFRHDVDVPARHPEGHQGMMVSRVETKCRFCGYVLATRTKRVIAQEDYIRGAR
jgi:hypothetical protein